MSANSVSADSASADSASADITGVDSANTDYYYYFNLTHINMHRFQLSQ